jgi:UPF0716 protein FxsA
MVKWLIAAILLLPLAEIVAFVLVGAAIGFGNAFVLIILTTILGAVVLSRAGRGQLAHFRAAVGDNGMTGIEIGSGGPLNVLAGLLLFVPGFLTSFAGAVLLIGPVQRWCSDAFRRRMVRRTPGDPSVVDLTPGEWQQVPEHRIENSLRDRN